jgi:hypothetical protein
MNVRNIYDDLMKNRLYVNDPKGEGLIRMSRYDFFRVFIGDGKGIYKFMWVDEIENSSRMPEKVMNMHVNETRLDACEGKLSFDCLLYPSKEFLENFSKKTSLRSYERGWRE